MPIIALLVGGGIASWLANLPLRILRVKPHKFGEEKFLQLGMGKKLIAGFFAVFWFATFIAIPLVVAPYIPHKLFSESSSVLLFCFPIFLVGTLSIPMALFELVTGWSIAPGGRKSTTWYRTFPEVRVVGAIRFAIGLSALAICVVFAYLAR